MQAKISQPAYANDAESACKYVMPLRCKQAGGMREERGAYVTFTYVSQRSS